MPNLTEARAVERVILVNIKEGISETQLDIVAQHGKELLGAIPGVEQVSFGIALQVYETHPNHAAFGLQDWLPIITNEILVDYVMAY